MSADFSGRLVAGPFPTDPDSLKDLEEVAAIRGLSVELLRHTSYYGIDISSADLEGTITKYKKIEQAFLDVFPTKNISLWDVPEKMRTYKVCLCALEVGRGGLSYIPVPLRDDKMYLMAIQHGNTLLKEIPVDKRTPEICLLAVHKRGDDLQHVPEDKRTLEVCRVAVQNSVRAINHVPKAFLPDLYTTAILSNGSALFYIPRDKRTIDLYRLAVQKKPYLISEVSSEYMEEEWYKEAVRKNEEGVVPVATPPYQGQDPKWLEKRSWYPVYENDIHLPIVSRIPMQGEAFGIRNISTLHLQNLVTFCSVLHDRLSGSFAAYSCYEIQRMIRRSLISLMGKDQGALAGAFERGGKFDFSTLGEFTLLILYNSGHTWSLCFDKNHYALCNSSFVRAKWLSYSEPLNELFFSNLVKKNPYLYGPEAPLLEELKPLGAEEGSFSFKKQKSYNCAKFLKSFKVLSYFMFRFKYEYPEEAAILAAKRVGDELSLLLRKEMIRRVVDPWVPYSSNQDEVDQLVVRAKETLNKKLTSSLGRCFEDATLNKEVKDLIIKSFLQEPSFEEKRSQPCPSFKRAFGNVLSICHPELTEDKAITHLLETFEGLEDREGLKLLINARLGREGEVDRDACKALLVSVGVLFSDKHREEIKVLEDLNASLARGVVNEEALAKMPFYFQEGLESKTVEAIEKALCGLLANSAHAGIEEIGREVFLTFHEKLQEKVFAHMEGGKEAFCWEWKAGTPLQQKRIQALLSYKPSSTDKAAKLNAPEIEETATVLYPPRSCCTIL